VKDGVVLLKAVQRHERHEEANGMQAQRQQQAQQ
jgi:hypothetical protein